MKKSGEEEWKKRLSKPADLQAGEVEVKLREKRGLDAPRPHSIADRLNLLETSQIGWKGRVEENDAKRFTVAHKLAGEWVGLSKGVCLVGSVQRECVGWGLSKGVWVSGWGSPRDCVLINRGIQLN